MNQTQRKLAIAGLSLAIVLILATLAWPATTIEGPKKADAGETVQLLVKGLAEADLPKAKVICYPREKVTMIPAKSWGGDPFVLFTAKNPGKYLVAIFLGGDYAETELEVGPQVNPPQPPPSPENPWKAAAEWQPTVEPLGKLKLQRLDATNLAAVYGNLSSELAGSAASGLNTSGDLRGELVRRGSSLSIKGKYPAAAEAVEACLRQALGLENVPLDKPRAAALLRTMAWAIWETGK